MIAIGLAVVAMGAGLLRSIQTVMDARGRVDKLARSRLSQLDRIRKAARTSMHLKRSIKDAERRKVEVEKEVEEATASLQVARSVDHRLFVLDERRTKADHNWVATVVHPAAGQALGQNVLPEAVASWRKGRRFLVYALDGGKAREKIVARYQDRQGFQVVSLEPQTQPLRSPHMDF